MKFRNITNKINKTKLEIKDFKCTNFIGQKKKVKKCEIYPSIQKPMEPQPASAT